ncbi:MAG: SMP-30/gluconolactonase/LRE family protein, partial [Planctomycetaceae bacterium]
GITGSSMTIQRAMYRLIVCGWLCGLVANSTAADLASIVAPGSELQRVVEDCKFSEGPAADAAGNVYFTDQPNDRIVKIAVDGTVSDFLKPAGRSNGMYFAPDGKLIACADEHNQMWAIDVASGSHQVLFDKYQGVKLNGPNDVWVHPNGVMYFTDPFYKRPWWTHNEPPQREQALYRVDADHKTVHREAEPFKQPNGIVGDAKRGVLFVADIGDKKTYRYPIHSDGTLGARTLFCQEGSDGMTLDDAGNLYLTGRGVNVFQADGTKLGVIEVPENWTANVCFGGPDHRTLFITASDSVYTLKMQTRGISDQR